MDLEAYLRSGNMYRGNSLTLSPEDLKPYGLLRVGGGGDVSTNYNAFVSEHDFQRIYEFARRARKAKSPRGKRIRLGAHGTKEMSATHCGDVRIGCTLVAWSELVKIERALRMEA
jgi:hypothetical protein